MTNQQLELGAALLQLSKDLNVPYEAVLSTAQELAQQMSTSVRKIQPVSKALSIQDVADRWGVSYDSVFRLVRKGELKAFKCANKWRIKPEELSKFESNNSN